MLRECDHTLRSRGFERPANAPPTPGGFLSFAGLRGVQFLDSVRHDLGSFHSEMDSAGDDRHWRRGQNRFGRGRNRLRWGRNRVGGRAWTLPDVKWTLPPARVNTPGSLQINCDRRHHYLSIQNLDRGGAKIESDCPQGHLPLQDLDWGGAIIDQGAPGTERVYLKGFGHRRQERSGTRRSQWREQRRPPDAAKSCRRWTAVRPTGSVFLAELFLGKLNDVEIGLGAGLEGDGLARGVEGGLPFFQVRCAKGHAVPRAEVVRL